MEKLISDIAIGVLFLLFGIFLISVSNKKCVSTFCSIPNKKSINRDVVGFMIGILLAIFGLVILIF